MAVAVSYSSQGKFCIVVLSLTVFVSKGEQDELPHHVFGQCLHFRPVGLGVLLWFAKDVAEADLQKGMGIALLIGAAAGLIIPAMGPTSGILHSNWWHAMLIYTSLGVANAYLVFQNPQKMTHRSFYR